MRNITVLAVLVIILNSAYCQDSKRNYGFSIGPQAGLVYGQSLELVDSIPEDTKGELLSELKWDLKPVYYIGIQIDIGRIDITSDPGFFTSLSFKAGYPADSGIIENRDWMSVENNALTHFSTHTNRTNSFFMADGAIGATLPVNSYIYFKPYIGGSWMYISFTGRGGQGTYAREKLLYSNTFHPIDDNPDLHSFEGEQVIHYQQNWILLYPGVSAGIKISPFIFDFSFKLSLFTWCTALDQHIYKQNTKFLDQTRTGLFYEPSVNISFIIKRLEISLGASYRHIGRTRGITHIDRNNSGYDKAANRSGAGLSLLDTHFLVKVRI